MMSTDPTCPTCSGPVKPGLTFCSHACYHGRAPAGMDSVPCPECKGQFLRSRKHPRTYCSKACSIAAVARMNKGRTAKKLHQHTVGRGRGSRFEPL